MILQDVYKLLKTKPLNEKIPYSHKVKTKNKVINLSIGRIWFNLITPDDYPLVTDVIDKKKLSFIIKDIYDKYDVSISSKFVDDINRESFKLGTIKPSSFDINSLVIPDHILKKKNELLKEDLDPDEFNTIKNKLAVEYLEYIKENYDSKVYNILMTGAKGSAADWANLMIAKGSTVDIEGNTTKPILHSLDEGLTVEEFYNTAAEARMTQFQKSKGSAEPGYLARKTAYANANITIQSDDCKTKRYLKLQVTKEISKQLFGRYFLNDGKLDIINENNISKLINKTISLRSPLYCKEQNGLCKICYGKLQEKLDTKKVGLIASAMVNDIGITKAMKARHANSQLNSREADFTKDIMFS
jgi:DNA-directed RNA polymerase subunit beta'